MTAEAFRVLALGLAGAEESTHGGHPDFRAGGKVFASLGYPDDAHGMVRLPPDRQAEFMEKAPHVFSPCKGEWGRRGATAVDLAAATKPLIAAALRTAADFVTASAKRKV